MARTSKRRIAAGVVVLALALVAPAAAHPVAVSDTSRADWFAKGAADPNIGSIARDATGRGEFVWTDAKGDQRIVDPTNTAIAREADLSRFSVTADATNIYFLAKVERYTGISNNPALQVMISIDSDATHTAGQTALPDGVATSVASAAAWENVIETQFAPGAAQSASVSAAPKVYPSGTTAGSAQLVSSSSSVTQGGYAEIQVPWSAIGGMPAPQNSLRFTVSTYYADHSAPSDGNASKAIDVLGSNPAGTLADLGADSTIKSYFELHFSATGEVFAPLLISEFLPDPPTSADPKGEWIEIFNPNSFDVSLNGYKLGDQAYRGGSQGMVQLPNQLLGAGKALVVANDKTLFKTRYPTVADASIIEMTTLPSYTSWASGKISLQNQNNGQPFKESIALLDASDTLVDLVQYAYKTPLGPTGLDPDNKPILLTSSAVAANASYDRCPSASDTNDSNNDFFVRDSSTPDRAPTPGLACTTVPEVDLRISKNGPESVEVGATTIDYVISFSNAGSTAASSVLITDTLPVGLTCVSQTATVSSGAITPPVGCPLGAPLTWNILSLASLASGTITLQVAIDPGIDQDISLTNTAGISNPSEPAATLHNNVASQTVITAGPADLTLSSDWALASGTAPGREFEYTITYANFGESDSNDITISDVLPPNVTLVSSSLPVANNATSGTLIWNVLPLGYQNSGTITLVVKIDRGVAPGTQLAHSLNISSSPADLARADEQPDTRQETLTVGNRQVFLPMIVK